MAQSKLTFILHLLIYALLTASANTSMSGKRISVGDFVAWIDGLRSVPKDSICRTLITTDSKENLNTRWRSDLTFPLVQLNTDKLIHDLRFDILSFQKELMTEHVITPSLFGTRKLSRNCGIILISGQDEEEGNGVGDILVSRRLARPHKDYFFFQFTGDVDLSPLNIIQKFSLLRYKHVVRWERGKDFLDLTEYCGSPVLFSPNCPWMITGRRFVLAASNTPALFRPETNFTPAAGTLRSAFNEIDYRFNSSTFIRLSTLGGSAGMRLNNGTGVWKGTVGDVFDRDVNISIATGMTMERLRFTDFSVTYVWNERVFFIRSPPIRRNWLTIVRPLHAIVWISTGVTLFGVVCPAMYTSAIFQEKFKSRLRNGWFFPYFIFRVLDTIFCVVLEQTTFTRIWRGSRVRGIITCWTIACLVVSTGYKAKLMTFLTFLDREEIPQTHLDLSLSDYKLYFRNYKGIVFLETRLSHNPMHKRFMAKARFPDHSFDCFEAAIMNAKAACMDFILNGEYTLAVNYTLRKSGGKEIFIMSQDKESIKWMIMWIFAKGSPLTATFDRVKLQMLATGMFEKWKGDDWASQKKEGIRWLETQKNSKVKDMIENLLEQLGSTGQSPLGFQNVQSIFALLGIGLGLGFIVWNGEFISMMDHRRARKEIFNKIIKILEPLQRMWPFSSSH